jgi:hypothetical protein
VLQYTFLTTFGVVITSTILSLLVESNHMGNIEFFCVRSNCVFGWCSQEWVKIMLTFGLTIGVICFTGFNYAIQYINPLVFSSVILVDPAVTGLIAYVAGIEGIPDSLTIAGGCVVIGGVLLITVGESDREQLHDPQDQAQARPTREDVEAGVELAPSSHGGDVMNDLNASIHADTSLLLQNDTNGGGSRNSGRNSYVSVSNTDFDTN